MANVVIKSLVNNFFFLKAGNSHKATTVGKSFKLKRKLKITYHFLIYASSLLEEKIFFFFFFKKRESKLKGVFP